MGGSAWYWHDVPGIAAQQVCLCMARPAVDLAVPKELKHRRELYLNV
jgi:hypothetical protein